MASSPQPSSADVEEPVANRRTSGRVSKQPRRFADNTPPGSTKRKRSDEDDEGIGMEDGDTDDDDSQEATEDEPDEEEVREKRRAARTARATRDKPVAKKPRGGGSTIDLAIRTTSTKPRQSRRKAKSPVVSGQEAEGLFGQVFVLESSEEKVVADWAQRFQSDEAASLAELVNLVLRAAGCSIGVDVHDIRDPDNARGRLTTIQEEFQAQNVVDYPLIAKGRGTAVFKKRLTGFFRSIINSFPVHDLLISKAEFLLNLSSWLPVMTSASTRPFRHTSTVVCCAIIAGLADVGRSLADSAAQNLRQVEAERKKSRANKGRIATLEKKGKEIQEQREKLDGAISPWLDSTFIHRYRDVDPKIRAENIIAIGDWIMVYPEFFFDVHYMRYLGWLLSDSSASIRLENLKQLVRLYKDKDKLSGLRAFTEKFRTRMVEMATRDAEANVRAVAVELVDILREAGLLEPNDIDSVGQLIFDSEARVRKAIVNFFAESINDLYESKLEGIGDKETLEALSSPSDDFEALRPEWLKLKCLVEALQTYDGPEATSAGLNNGQNHIAVQSFEIAQVETRFSLAAQALCDAVPEVKQWKTLAGYLLFDHTQTSSNRNEDPEAVLTQECKLSEREEVILLEILGASIKISLTEAMEELDDKKIKKTKARKAELQEIQEDTARHLASLIPRLLHKFGAAPEPATAVLRLGHILNLDIFQELRQDSSTFASLLDDINQQFLTHGSSDVLNEATTALMHAKQFDALDEVTESKLQALWESTTFSLHIFGKEDDLKTRGNLSPSNLKSLSNTVLRIANLARIADCTSTLEAAPATSSQKSKSRKETPKSTSNEPANAVTVLLSLIHRATAPPISPVSDSDDLEEGIAVNSATSLMFYFMWKLAALQKDIVAANTSSPLLRPVQLEHLAERRNALVSIISEVLNSRILNRNRSKAKKVAQGLNDVTFGLVDVLLDVCIMFPSTLRTAKPARAGSQGGWNDEYLKLISEIPARTQGVILKLLASAEKDFADKAGRSIELADSDAEGEDAHASINDDPESDEGEDDEDDSEPEDEQNTNGAGPGVGKVSRKQRNLLTAEQRLCGLGSRLVLAILSGVIDTTKARIALERNKTKLGPNWKEVVSYLQKADTGQGRKARGKNKETAKSGGAAKPSKEGKRPISNETVSIEDEEDGVDNGENEDSPEVGEEVAAEEHEDQVEMNGVESGAEDNHVESVMGD
ncbi:MAG: hypothetical protein M1822_007130 [Bathelium mastoideum]|nr:MAG: hypothetical protein M1822_007130 [Bathelium mastoideum]